MFFSHRRAFQILLLLLPAAAFPLSAADSAGAKTGVSEAQWSRGKRIYSQYCFMCHQGSGQGAATVFPPLARSDFLMADKERSIVALVKGLAGQIVVNGATYNGVMPPAPLGNQELADVLTFVRNEWGNRGDAVSAGEVASLRKTITPALPGSFTEPNPFSPLPKTPEGISIRELARLPNHPTRMASDGSGKVLYVLCVNGDVWRVDSATGELHQLFFGEKYIDLKRGDPNTVGLAMDGRRRFYIVVNQRYEGGALATNECTIYRTAGWENGEPSEPRPWLQTRYPWGIGPFNHGVGHAAIGPDGFLYVNSGARTDGGEAGRDSRYWTGGEDPLTACIWRLDPELEKPGIEIFARGLRNAYGFCWNEKGEMFATENGPDADAPEELNQIERGKHYGFPFQFSNWTNKPYAHTPDPPRGLKVTLPIANLGPDGGFDGRPLFTFDPHSSPAGIVYLGGAFSGADRDSFLITRFGNLLKRPRDVGFDLLQVRLKKNQQGIYEATTRILLSPLARPIDVHVGGPGRIYLCEYSRMINNRGDIGMLPGRILELSIKR